MNDGWMDERMFYEEKYYLRKQGTELQVTFAVSVLKRLVLVESKQSSPVVDGAGFKAFSMSYSRSILASSCASSP